MRKTIADIQERLRTGNAVVLTKSELMERLSKRKPSMDDVDIVTTATRGIMSGTYCLLSFKVAPKGAFRKASKVWMNGIECVVGPCPNEFLGMLDILVIGTSHSKKDPCYGGGHLFRDLVSGEHVDVEVLTDEGETIRRKVRLKDIDTARLFGTRHAFKNYSCFINTSKVSLDTIFSVCKFGPNSSMATVSGCGMLSPLENDPELSTIAAGSPILVNGAPGMILGPGTRCSTERPNVSTMADMKQMDPALMGGFKTSAGPEVICSIAMAIPMLSNTIFESLARGDNEIPLNIAEVKGREPLDKGRYSDVWFGNEYVSFHPRSCKHCKDCPVTSECPTNAFEPKRGKDDSLCFQCGHCVGICRFGAFECQLGSVRVKGKNIPIVLRQSDRFAAGRLADTLKRMLLEKRFLL